MARQWQNLGVEAATYGSISMYTYIYTHTRECTCAYIYINNYIYILPGPTFWIADMFLHPLSFCLYYHLL